MSSLSWRGVENALKGNELWVIVKEGKLSTTPKKELKSSLTCTERVAHFCGYGFAGYHTIAKKMSDQWKEDRKLLVDSLIGRGYRNPESIRTANIEHIGYLKEQICAISQLQQRLDGFHSMWKNRFKHSAVLNSRIVSILVMLWEKICALYRRFFGKEIKLVSDQQELSLEQQKWITWIQGESASMGAQEILKKFHLERLKISKNSHFLCSVDNTYRVFLAVKTDSDLNLTLLFYNKNDVAAGGIYLHNLQTNEKGQLGFATGSFKPWLVRMGTALKKGLKISPETTKELFATLKCHAEISKSSKSVEDVQIDGAFFELAKRIRAAQEDRVLKEIPDITRVKTIVEAYHDSSN